MTAPVRAGRRFATRFARRFDIDSVQVIDAKDVSVTAVDGGFEVAAVYSHKAPFIGNISFLVEFDKRAMIRK